jgi:cell filamentation protein
VTGDPYLDPRSGVFRNRLGLTDRAELAVAEQQYSATRANQLERRRLPGRYDLDHLRAFHWTIFQDVYP